MNYEPNNRLIAKKRGNQWKKALITGRLSIQNSPSELRFRRVNLGLSQAEVAKLSGLTTNTYGAIESKRRPVKKDRAEKILKSLKITKNNIKMFFSYQDNDKFLAV